MWFGQAQLLLQSSVTQIIEENTNTISRVTILILDIKFQVLKLFCFLAKTVFYLLK